MTQTRGESTEPLEPNEFALVGSLGGEVTFDQVGCGVRPSLPPLAAAVRAYEAALGHDRRDALARGALAVVAVLLLDTGDP